MTLVCLGYIEQGRALTNQALSEARRLKHAHTLATALLCMCRAEWFAARPMTCSGTRGSGGSGERAWLSTLVEWWNDLPRMVIDCARPSEGRRRLLTQGLAATRATGAVQGTPVILTLLAQAYAKLGRLPESQNCLAEAGQIIEATDER